MQKANSDISLLKPSPTGPQPNSVKNHMFLNSFLLPSTQADTFLGHQSTHRFHRREALVYLEKPLCPRCLYPCSNSIQDEPEPYICRTRKLLGELSKPPAVLEHERNCWKLF